MSHQVWLLPVLDAVKVSPLIEKVSDHKDFKKLLRTRTNVLVLYTKTGETSWVCFGSSCRTLTDYKPEARKRPAPGPGLLGNCHQMQRKLSPELIWDWLELS